MAEIRIEERPGGAIIVGTRIGVEDVLSYFLVEPPVTEETIGQMLNLTADQVAAARTYIFQNVDTVLTAHLRLEERSKLDINPPEVVERARRTRAALAEFRAWLDGREAADALDNAAANGEAGREITFGEWLARQEVGSARDD